MLADIALFAGLSQEALVTVEGYMVGKSYRKNTIVVEKGDDAASMYIILSGSVKVFIADNEGKEIILNILEPGEYFGELALLGKPERTASVIALEDSKMLMITKTAFTECLNRNPEIALNLIGGLVCRINSLIQKVSDLGLKDVYGRITSLLGQRAQLENGKLVTGRLTQQQIANEVGSTRETVTRILKELKIGGYLSVTGGQYTLEKKLPAKW